MKVEKNSKISYISKFFLLAVVIWMVFCNALKHGVMNNEVAVSFCQRILLVILVVMGCYWKIKNKLDFRHIIYLLIFGGIIMRISYAIYTPYYVRTHDLGDFSSNECGHLNYIYLLYNNTMTNCYDFQFYHPPFYHFMCAMVLKFYHMFHRGVEINSAVDMVKTVGCFASCASLLICDDIFKKLKMTDFVRCISVAIVAFMPSFYLIGGCVNNDALAVMFIFLAFLATLCWYESRKFRDLMSIALVIGFGMMTKLSVGTVALFTGAVMIYVWYQDIKKGSGLKTLINYCIFMVVCAPLGLWHTIRQFVKFGQPIGYVMDPDAAGISAVYVGDHSIWERFFAFPISQIISNPYNNSFEDYNINLYVIRSSLFGEYGFGIDTNIASKFAYINMTLIFISLVAMIAVLVKGKKINTILRFMPGAIWLINMVSFYSFNINYPDACTMDYRYIVPTCVCGAMYIGMVLEMLYDKFNLGGDKRKRVVSSQKSSSMYYGAMIAYGFIILLIVLFVLYSVYFYSMLS